MEKTKKQYFHLFLLLLFSFCVTIKSNGKPHILNRSDQQFGVSRNPIYTHPQSVEEPQNLTKILIKDCLKKLKNPKYLSKVGTFIAGMTTGLAASRAVHLFGHWTTWNFFYPNSTGIEKTGPYIDLENIDLNKDNNHFKVALGFASGPIIGFLSSHSSLKLLAKHNATKSTCSPFLSGLEFGLKGTRYWNISTLINIAPSTDGYRVIQVLRKKHPSYDKEWYSYAADLLTTSVILILLKSDLVKHWSHLFS